MGRDVPIHKFFHNKHWYYFSCGGLCEGEVTNVLVFKGKWESFQTIGFWRSCKIYKKRVWDVQQKKVGCENIDVWATW